MAPIAEDDHQQEHRQDHLAQAHAGVLVLLGDAAGGGFRGLGLVAPARQPVLHAQGRGGGRRGAQQPGEIHLRAPGLGAFRDQRRHEGPHRPVVVLAEKGPLQVRAEQLLLGGGGQTVGHVLAGEQAELVLAHAQEQQQILVPQAPGSAQPLAVALQGRAVQEVHRGHGQAHTGSLLQPLGGLGQVGDHRGAQHSGGIGDAALAGRVAGRGQRGGYQQHAGQRKADENAKNLLHVAASFYSAVRG